MANKKVNFLITAKDQASKTFRILNNTMKSVKRTVGGITKALGKFTLVTGATATAVALLSKRFMDQIDSIDKVSKKIGVGADFLQKLRFASEITGVEIRTTDMALQRFTRRMAEARIGTGEALPALKELGVSFFDTNGQARDTEDVFFDVARALNEVDDDATKLRLGFKLFDSEGVALVTTMGALIQQFQIFDDLGLGLGDDNIKKVADLKDNLTEVSNIVNLIGMSTFAGLSDEIDSIVTALKTKLMKAIGDDANAFAQEIGEKIKAIVIALVKGIETMLNGLVFGINKIAELMQSISDKFGLGIDILPGTAEVKKRRKVIEEQLAILKKQYRPGDFDLGITAEKDKSDLLLSEGLNPNISADYGILERTLIKELNAIGSSAVLESFDFADTFVNLLNESLGNIGTGNGTASIDEKKNQW